MDAVFTSMKDKAMKRLFHSPNPNKRRSLIQDMSNGGRNNFITTIDANDLKDATAYTYRIDWGWERAPEAELEWHPPKNTKADQQFDKLLEQDQKRKGKKRNKLQKRIRAKVHEAF